MRIISIDPGSNITGYAITESGPTIITSGVIKLKGSSLGNRLLKLEQELLSIITDYGPTMAAIEKTFTGKYMNIGPLSHARGVCLLTLAKHNISYHEYEPKLVKKAMTGSGKADKRMVQAMVRSMFGVTVTSDEADAIAVAVCYWNRVNIMGIGVI